MPLLADPLAPGLRAGPDLPLLDNRSIGSRRALQGGVRREDSKTMEIVIAAAVLAAGLVVAALLLVRRSPGLAAAGRGPSAPARAAVSGPTDGPGKAERDDALSRRQEIGRMEARLSSREEALD